MAKRKTSNKADVVVVGGGLAGLTLASLLGRQGVDVICIDRDDPVSQLDTAYDGRTTAISYGSRQVLAAAGVWPVLEKAGQGACPIRTIQIMDGADKDAPLSFDSAEAGGRTFGWIVENRDFRRTLFEHVRGLRTVRHIAPARVTGFTVKVDAVIVATDTQNFTAPLIIGADGRQSFTRDWMGINTRTWPYRQQAIICCVTHEQPHRNIAVEHFRSEGPFAILPMADDADGLHRSSLVWTDHLEARHANLPLTWSIDAFNAGLNARFPAWYGRVALHGKRFAYPLSLSHAHSYIGPRMALVAEAAHAIHPIAGQGLNIGFRDVAALGDLVVNALEKGEDPGADPLLEDYQRQRRLDNMAMAGATDSLNRLFSNALPPVALARRAGLRAVSRLPFAKRFFMSQAMGAAGILQDLIQG